MFYHRRVVCEDEVGKGPVLKELKLTDGEMLRRKEVSERATQYDVAQFVAISVQRSLKRDVGSGIVIKKE